jgi:hypothetical protein
MEIQIKIERQEKIKEEKQEKPREEKWEKSREEKREKCGKIKKEKCGKIKEENQIVLPIESSSSDKETITNNGKEEQIAYESSGEKSTTTKETVILVHEIEGKKIRKSYLDKTTGMLYNDSGICYFSEVPPHKEGNQILHDYKIKKIDFFRLMEIEKLEFHVNNSKMEFDVCKNNISQWSANIYRIENAGNVEGEFILNKEIKLHEERDEEKEKEEEKENIELSVNISKKAKFKIVYFDENRNIVLTRNISFKSNRALGRDYIAENERKKELNKRALHQKIQIKQLNQINNDNDKDVDVDNDVYVDYDDDDEEKKRKDDGSSNNHDGSDNEFQNFIKKIKLEQ